MNCGTGPENLRCVLSSFGSDERGVPSRVGLLERNCGYAWLRCDEMNGIISGGMRQDMLDGTGGQSSQLYAHGECNTLYGMRF